MEPNVIFVIFVVFAGVAITTRLLAGQLDRSRIAAYLASRGSTLLSAKWQPFGPGWFADKTDRIYRITYRDSEGDVHRAYCKTSMLSGVYLTEDGVVNRASRSKKKRTRREERRPDAPSVERLTDENRKLREENERLRRELEGS